MRDRMQTQSNEFTALADLCKAFHDLPAVVDDDYPRARHVYEGKLNAFIIAVFLNRPEQTDRAISEFILRRQD